MRHGKGLLTQENGGTIEGQWHKNVQEGVAIEKMSDGSCFQGWYSDGKRNGFGE